MEVLSAQSIWTPGADLWITAPPAQSKITQNMDWYMNFQITKSLSSQMPNISERLQEILDRCELSNLSFQDDENHILIAAQKFLPTQWLLISSFSENWAEQLVPKWQKLNRPKARIFLPDRSHLKSFESQWRKLAGDSPVSLVGDSWTN